MDESVTLNADHIVRSGVVEPGSPDGRWTYRIGAFRYKGRAALVWGLRLGEGWGELRMIYDTLDVDGEPERQEQIIDLTATPQPLGGVRWWFRCPLTKRKVTKLHLPPGYKRFGSRVGYRLGYETQRSTEAHCAKITMTKIERRLGCEDTDYINKPKWVRWGTYNHMMARYEVAADIDADALEWLAVKALRRMGFGQRA